MAVICQQKSGRVGKMVLLVPNWELANGPNTTIGSLQTVVGRSKAHSNVPFSEKHVIVHRIRILTQACGDVQNIGRIVSLRSTGGHLYKQDAGRNL